MDRLVGWCEVDEHAGVQGKDWGKWGGGASLVLNQFCRAFYYGKVHAISLHLYYLVYYNNNDKFMLQITCKRESLQCMIF